MAATIPRAAAAAAGFLIAVLHAGCGTQDGGGEAAERKDVPQVTAAMSTSEAEWREERRMGLLAEDGWMTLVGLHPLELPAHYVGSGATSGVRLALGPEHLGLVQQEGARVWFTPERGVSVESGGKPVRGRIDLAAGSTGEPVELRFDDGQGRLSLVTRGNRRALRVRHAQAPARSGFRGIEYWPVDGDWVLEGDFQAYPAGHAIEIGNIVGGVDRLPSPGVVAFTRDGVDHRLEALEGEDGGLFLLMADLTSGQGSYGAGRYLDTVAPDAQGRVILNFNRAYNPPCAFTDFATCPLPPPGNRLQIAVTAGEKIYARPVQAAAGP